MAELLGVSCVLLLGWFWLDSLRAREIAIEICRAACQKHDLQLLDQTVALSRLGLQRTDAGLRLRRVYQFDFSEEGLTRRGGYLVLLGLDLVSIGVNEQRLPIDH